MHVLAGCFHFHRPCLSKFLLCAFHARLPVMVMKRGGCGLSHGHMGMEKISICASALLPHAFCDSADSCWGRDREAVVCMRC